MEKTGVLELPSNTNTYICASRRKILHRLTTGCPNDLHRRPATSARKSVATDYDYSGDVTASASEDTLQRFSHWLLQIHQVGVAGDFFPVHHTRVP